MTAHGVILLMGATATGKTELALDLAARFAVEIVSVDSALIYRDMNIGTAKPEPEIRQKVPHHLIDIIDPTEQFSVWDFVSRAHKLIAEISARGRICLFVGGTMMYYHAFEHGLNRLPEADDRLRNQLDAEGSNLGWPALHARLAALDPMSAARIKPGDSQRIQRALEVYAITGEPLSVLQQRETSGYTGALSKIILAVDDRAALHRRIDSRFHHMLEAGFVDEVRQLKLRDDLDLSRPSMRCVGYRQIWQYLDGEFSRQQMIEKSIAATRQLAKRQITWLRRQPRKSAFDCLNYRKDDIFRFVEAVSLGQQAERY